MMARTLPTQPMPSPAAGSSTHTSCRPPFCCPVESCHPESPTSKLRVESFTISLVGFGAGADQDLANPLGVGGGALHGWALSTRTFQSKVFGTDGGQACIDDDFATRGFANMGAWILGRNMFGPVRGPWPDESWRGWWGDIPVYRVPVFVLIHHARPPLVMEGGTTFHFVTEGIEVSLARAREAAQGKDVRVGGGVSVIQHVVTPQATHLVISRQ